MTPIAAHGASAAWSRYDDHAYHLVIWRDGKARRAPVKPRGAPFDVDLGRDARGRLVAVYSRCADDVHSVRRLDFVTATWLDTPVSTTWLHATQTSGGHTWTVTDMPGGGYAISRT